MYKPAHEVAAAAKVGDEVGINSRYEFQDPTFGKVARITKTRIILESGKRFNMNGYVVDEPSYSSHQSRLMSVEDAREEIASNKARRELNHARGLLEQYEWKRLNAEQAASVLELLATFKKGE